MGKAMFRRIRSIMQLVVRPEEPRVIRQAIHDVLVTFAERLDRDPDLARALRIFAKDVKEGAV